MKKSPSSVCMYVCNHVTMKIDRDSRERKYPLYTCERVFVLPGSGYSGYTPNPEALRGLNGLKSHVRHFRCGYTWLQGVVTE